MSVAKNLQALSIFVTLISICYDIATLNSIGNCVAVMQYGVLYSIVWYSMKNGSWSTSDAVCRVPAAKDHVLRTFHVEGFLGSSTRRSTAVAQVAHVGCLASELGCNVADGS